MTPSIRSIVLLCSAALLACGDPTGPGEYDALGEPAGFFRTSSTGYRLESGEIAAKGEIPFSYKNTTGRTLYIVNCRGEVPPSLEKLEDDEWVHAWSAVTMRCLSAPVVIGPGETYRDTLRVWGAWHDVERYGPNFEVPEVEGRYRLVWHHVLWSFDANAQGFGPEIPKELRVSNEFVIDLVED